MLLGSPCNPFATHHLALPFHEPEGAPPDLPARLLDDALAQQGGAIVGPHGTGKSTLLRAVYAEVKARSLRGLLSRMPSESGWPFPEVWRFLRQTPPAGAPSLLLLDGAQQLFTPLLWGLRLACRLRRVTLLVTSHQPLGLPVLRRTEVDERLIVRLAAAVLARSPESPLLVSADEAPDALRRAQGNARDALFTLHDRYERRWLQAQRDRLR